MSDNLEKNSNNTQNVLQSGKKLLTDLKDRKYFSAIKEFFRLFKILYNNNLKGRYITVKDKKIPLTAVVIAALIVLYVVYPNANPESNKTSLETSEKNDTNSYNKDGIRVYELRKCDQSVCGILENATENNYAHIIISLTFHDQTGKVIYEGGVNATDIIPMARMKIVIPCSEDFAYFKLKNVELQAAEK